jgi:predicted transcriptional regulator
LFEISSNEQPSSANHFRPREYRVAETDQPDLTTLTVQLLSAYVANNSVPSSELAGLIETTRAALASKPEPETPPHPEFEPAVSVRKSVGSRDHILSMIDGKPYRSLKRHLSSHGLTPAEYRKRYNLAEDYPMVAPGYSEQRREVAKRLGLGRKPRAAVSASEPAAPVSSENTATGQSSKTSVRTSRAKSSRTSGDTTMAQPKRRRAAAKVAKKSAQRKAATGMSTGQESPPTE